MGIFFCCFQVDWPKINFGLGGAGGRVVWCYKSRDGKKGSLRYHPTQLTNAWLYFVILSYRQDLLYVTLVHWCSCMLGSIWFLFLVLEFLTSKQIQKTQYLM